MEFLSQSRRRKTSQRRRARRNGCFRRPLGLSLHRGSVVTTIAVQEKNFVTCISMNSRRGFARKVFFFFYPFIERNSLEQKRATHANSYPQCRTGRGEGGGGWWNPFPEFLIYCSITRNDFAFIGRSLIFSTRWVVLDGWWRFWKLVTSPTMVALYFTKN